MNNPNPNPKPNPNTLIKFPDLGIALIKRAASFDLVTLNTSDDPHWYLATIDCETATVQLHNGHPIVLVSLPDDDLS